MTYKCKNCSYKIDNENLSVICQQCNTKNYFPYVEMDHETQGLIDKLHGLTGINWLILLKPALKILIELVEINLLLRGKNGKA